jgi:hypothetical protein
MLDLNAGVDFDKVMPILLVDKELGRACVAVPDVPGDLDGVGQDGLANLLGKVGGRSDLNNLLVATLDGAVALKQMDTVALTVGEELNFNVPRTLEESLDEHGSIAKGGLGFADGTLKRILELFLVANDTHSSTSSSHSGLDDYREAVLLDE